MSAADTAAGLSGFAGRGAGTDAERRAAQWLASQLREMSREAELETFWIRPNWALANALCAALAVAGSLLTRASPIAGGAVVLVALVLVLVDRVSGLSPARRLTRERASQNVVSRPAPSGQTTLIVTANYDAGRAGLVHRQRLRRVSLSLRRITGGGAPGWCAWLALAMIWLIVVAVLRDRGASGTGIGAVQLVPTAGLLLAAALLVELGIAPFGPAAGDNGSGVAVALALVRTLEVAPPRHLAVELVLQGASDGSMAGLRRHLRDRAEQPGATVVLGVAPCGSGSPRWWESDGPVVPLRFDARLRRLASGVAASETHLGAAPHRGRGTTPALPARALGLPAISIGCLGPEGLAPRSHQLSDTAGALDPAALDATLELALALVDGLDAALGAMTAARSSAAS